MSNDNYIFLRIQRIKPVEDFKKFYELLNNLPLKDLEYLFSYKYTSKWGKDIIAMILNQKR